MEVETQPSEETIQRMVVLVQSGNDFYVSAAAVGVMAETFDEWMRLGESTDPDNEFFVDFRRQLVKARAMAEISLISKVQQAAAGGSNYKASWQAAVWLLERGFDGRWVKKSVNAKKEQSLATDMEPTEAPDQFADLDNVTELRPRA